MKTYSRAHVEEGQLLPAAFIFHICRKPMVIILLDHMQAAKTANRLVGINLAVIHACKSTCINQFQNTPERFRIVANYEHLTRFMETHKFKAVIFLIMSTLRLPKDHRAYGNPAICSREEAMEIARMKQDELFPVHNHGRLAMLAGGFDHIGRFNKLTVEAERTKIQFEAPDDNGTLLAYNPLRNLHSTT